MKLSGSSAARGTLLFMISALAVKALGAVYKIPLYNILGGYGIGLYQMVFPVYALLLTLSGSGVPSALTKLIGSGADAEDALNKSLKIFLSAGVIFTFFTLVFCRFIAEKQGDVNAWMCYAAICPSIAVVSAIACLRGYFQGKGTFAPTAVSQLVEQLVKMCVGLGAVLYFGNGAAEKAAWCCLAVTASEAAALVFLIIKFYSLKKLKICENNRVITESNFAPDELCGRKAINNSACKKHKFRGDIENNKNGYGSREQALGYGKLLSFVIPLTLTSLFLPFAGFADSFLVINELKPNFTDATALYGLYSGGADTVIGLPVAVLLALALGFLPRLSQKRVSPLSYDGDIKLTGVSDKAECDCAPLLGITAALSACACAGILLFAPIIVDVLFYNLSSYKVTLINLLRLSSVNVIFLSMLQSSNTVLLARGKQYYPLFSVPLGIAVKTVLVLTLVSRPEINIFGMAISDIACYSVALSANLVYIIYSDIKRNKKNPTIFARSKNIKTNGGKTGGEASNISAII